MRNGRGALAPALPPRSTPVTTRSWVTIAGSSTKGAWTLALQTFGSLPLRTSSVLAPAIVAYTLCTPLSSSVAVALTEKTAPSSNCAFSAGVAMVTSGATVSLVTCRTAVAVLPQEAERVTSTGDATGLVVNGTPALDWPAGTVTVAGSTTTAAAELCRRTTAPAAGAGSSRVMV